VLNRTQYPSDGVALVVLWRLRYKLSLRDLAEMFLVRGPYVNVQGRWCYLYRAIDTSGALVDVRLSETRDVAAAKAFFQSAKAVTGITPARVTTDGHDSYPRAIRTELGEAVRHRTNQYLNNRIEQDHRGIKGRYQPMRGFKDSSSAGRFCRTTHCGFSTTGMVLESLNSGHHA
jgi:transposase-like protein